MPLLPMLDEGLAAAVIVTVGPDLVLPMARPWAEGIGDATSWYAARLSGARTGSLLVRDAVRLEEVMTAAQASCVAACSLCASPGAPMVVVVG